jgi:hypothetical protein
MVRRLAVIGVIVGPGVTAPAAIAKVWFSDLQSERLRWDQRVVRTISNCPGNDSCRAAVAGTQVYLVRGPFAPRGEPRRGHRIARIDANGTLRFRVPHVVGRYHLVGNVKAGSTRRLIAVSGTFRIAR